MGKRPIQKLWVVVAATVVFGCLAVAPPAGATHGPALISHPVVLPSYTDARGDFPTRPGTTVIKQMHYGPFTIGAGAQIHNALDTITPPCTNCYITDMVPSLLDGTTGGPGSTVQNLNNGGMLHHFVFLNPGPGKVDATCPGIGPGVFGERLGGAGNERTHMHLPNGYGYAQGSNNNWNLVTHIVNKSATTKNYWIEVTFRYYTSPAVTPVRPIWLDIDGMSPACGDSEYPVNAAPYSEAHQSWVSTLTGRMVSLSGHMHDVDITGPGSCTTHCPSGGEGIAVNAELIPGQGSASGYYGPPPSRACQEPDPYDETDPDHDDRCDDAVPTDLTSATMCRSEGYYGTNFAAGQWLGHLDTVSSCGVFTAVPAGAQALAYPAGGAWPVLGYKINEGDTIKLHSEYANNTGFQQTDAMGIMIGYLAPEPYPRPKAATPLNVSLVPAFTACASPNRFHGGPLNYQSCNPVTRPSTALTIGTPEVNSTVANSTGFAKFIVVLGNTATPADEADVLVTVDMKDIRNNTGAPWTDYTGQLELRLPLVITDRGTAQSDTATGQSIEFAVTVPCNGTVDTAIGSTCSVSTSVDAVQLGTVLEARRSNVEMGRVRVNDGGTDGQASTQPNNLFAVQGVYVP